MSKNLEQIEQTDFGNTKQNPKPKQVISSRHWCFTFNNYNSKDIEQLEQIFNNNCEKYIFENEIGEKGTPHLQGYIITIKKCRPTELGLSRTIHWEKCKGKEQDNILYCSKDFRNKVDNCKVYKSSNINIPRPLKIINDLRKWQSDLKKIVEDEPDDRKIIWVYEKKGNVGKSAFSKYMVVKHNALYITEGKKSDIINIVYNYVLTNELNILILDVPRDNGNKVSYKSLEEIKNGLICNTKYETGNKVINAPHIIVFSNSPPEYDKFSLDRWEVYNIVNNTLERDVMERDEDDEEI